MNIKFEYNLFILITGLLFILISLFFIFKKTYYRKIYLLRLSILLFLLLFILNPIISIYEKEYKIPEIIYLIDSSIYMRSSISKKHNISKINYVKNFLSKNNIPINKIYFVADKIYKYDEFNNIPIDIYYSDLENSIKTLNHYIQDYDKLLYFTDGYSSFELSDKIMPVFVGEKESKEKKIIENLRYPEVAFLHIPFNIYFDVLDYKGHLYLFEDNKEIAEKEFNNNTFKNFFTITPSMIGKHDYKICLSDKINKECREFSINILREKLRILYLSGIPNHNYSFLREYLKSNSSNELVSFIILRELYDSLNVSEEDLSLIPFPREEIFLRDLFHFDVLILEEFDFQNMGIGNLYLDNIAEFVNKGGSLLIIGGDIMGNSLKSVNSEKFKNLLPIKFIDTIKTEISEFYFSSHPISAAIGYYMPSINGIIALSKVSDEARDIVSFIYSGKKYPFIADKKYGKGRVLIINSSAIWQWKMSFSDIRYDSYYFYNFYRAIFSWLDFTLDLNRADYSIMKENQFYVNAYVYDENYKILTRDSVKFLGYIDKKIPLTFRFQSNGIYRAYFPPLPIGKHKLEVKAFFENGYTENYSNYFYIEENKFYKEGFLSEIYEKYFKEGKAIKIDDLNIRDLYNSKKEIKRLSKTLNINNNEYVLFIFIFLVAFELIYRRFKSEL